MLHLGAPFESNVYNSDIYDKLQRQENLEEKQDFETQVLMALTMIITLLMLHVATHAVIQNTIYHNISLIPGRWTHTSLAGHSAGDLLKALLPSHRLKNCQINQVRWLQRQ
jgi:hypothetical protein